jgi:hypothetical protein
MEKGELVQASLEDVKQLLYWQTLFTFTGDLFAVKCTRAFTCGIA